MALLIGIGAGLGVAAQVVHPHPLAWGGQGVPTLDAWREAAAEIPGVGRFQDVAAIREACLGGSATLIDARSAQDYAQNHLTGAVSLPADALDATAAARAFTYIPPGLPVFIYCDRQGCPSASRTARFLIQQGFSGLSIFEPGWRGLQGHDLPRSAGAWRD